MIERFRASRGALVRIQGIGDLSVFLQRGRKGQGWKVPQHMEGPVQRMPEGSKYVEQHHLWCQLLVPTSHLRQNTWVLIKGPLYIYVYTCVLYIYTHTCARTYVRTYALTYMRRHMHTSHTNSGPTEPKTLASRGGPFENTAPQSKVDPTFPQ